MKILLLSTIYHIEGRPDLFHDTSAIHYLVKHWAKDNEVRVLNTYTHSYKKVLRYLNAENRKNYNAGYSFEKDGVKVKLVEIQKAPGQGCYFLRYQRKKIMEAFKELVGDGFMPDVIVTHFPGSSVYYLPQIQDYYGRKIPVIGVMHRTDVTELEKGRLKPYLLERNCDVLFSRSQAIHDRAEKFGLKNLRSDIVSSGVAISKENIEFSSRRGETLRIIFAGKIKKQKHIEVIILALEKLKSEMKVTLELVGSGDDEGRLKALAAKCKVSDLVTFTGRKPREEVLKRMRDSDLFCMTSINETLGLVYLEAMSVGCVPIGTKGEGIDGIIVDGENGYLVDRDNMVDSLIDIIRKYNKLSIDEQNEMKKRAVETSKDYDEEARSKIYLDLICETLRNNI
jgi:glycosyltransferase involved in cell wall biosynthesis